MAKYTHEDLAPGANRPKATGGTNFLNPVKYWEDEDAATLNFDAALKYARDRGYTGPANQATQFLAGMVGKTGTPNANWTQGSFDPAFQGGIEQGALLSDLKSRGLMDDFQSGFRDAGSSGFGGDWFPMLMAAGMVGAPAASLAGAGGAAAGTGALEGAAGAAEGALGAGEFSLAGGAGGTGIGGGSAGLGYGGAGGVSTQGGIGLGATGGAAGSGVATGSMLGGGLGLEELLKSVPADVWKSGLQGVLGYLGADAKGDALKDASDKWLGQGQWARDRYQQTFTDPKYFTKNYRGVLDQIADDSTRAWSARSGNPANNPGVQGSIVSDVWNRGLMPLMQNERTSLNSFGWGGANVAGQADLAGADFSNPWLTGLGTAAGSYFGGQQPEPKKDPTKTTLTVGGNPWGN